MKQAIEKFVRSVRTEWVEDMAVGALASLVLALCAPFSLYLPFTPIPVTIQVHVLLFMVAFLGPRKGVWMVLAFILQGAMGWPVFAGGASTVLTIMGPRGGYLLGYVVAAYAVGKLYQARENQSMPWLFVSMAAGNVIIHLLGLFWLSQFVGIKKAFLLGVAPFALVDLLKLTLFATLKSPATKLVQWFYRA